MTSNAWVTLKPTVGWPDFFMLIGRQTRFWSADWSCHIKNIPHQLPSPTTKFFIRLTVARWSANCISLSGNMQRVGWQPADLRATVGQPIIWSIVAISSPDSCPTLNRSPKPKNLASYNFFLVGWLKRTAKIGYNIGRLSIDCRSVRPTDRRPTVGLVNVTTVYMIKRLYRRIYFTACERGIRNCNSYFYIS